MNNKPFYEEPLLEQLERATAPGKAVFPDGDSETLDAETAELRGSWLALGELLEQADEEAAREASPARVTLARDPVTSPAAPNQAALTRTWFAGALAASLLLVITTTVWWQSQARVQNPIQPGTIVRGPGTAPAPKSPGGEVPPVMPMPESPAPEQVVVAGDEWDWDDDELDDQIDAAGHAVVSVEQDWFASSAPARVLNDRLDQMEETWDNDSL